MATIEFIFHLIFILVGLVLLAAIVRYPKTFFVKIPLAIIKFPFYIIKEYLFAGFFLGLFGLIMGKDIHNKYKTERRRFLTFRNTNKFLLAPGTNEGVVKLKVTEGLESLKSELRIIDFQFLITNEKIIIIPPKEISFYHFNYLIQWMTKEKVKIIGRVESKRLAYTVYDDPATENLIGKTDKGEKFFISLVDNFDRRQFLRINKDIEVTEENDVSNIKVELRADQSIMYPID